SAFYRGFSLGELVWGLAEEGARRGKYVVRAIKFKNVKQIGFEVDDYMNIRAITSWTPVGGMQRFPREKAVLYIYNPKDELPYGDSDLRAVHKHWMSKDSLIKFWDMMLQKTGQPLLYAQAGNVGDSAGM